MSNQYSDGGQYLSCIMTPLHSMDAGQAADPDMSGVHRLRGLMWEPDSETLGLY